MHRCCLCLLAEPAAAAGPEALLQQLGKLALMASLLILQGGGWGQGSLLVPPQPRPHATPWHPPWQRAALELQQPLRGCLDSVLEYTPCLPKAPDARIHLYLLPGTHQVVS